MRRLLYVVALGLAVGLALMAVPGLLPDGMKQQIGDALRRPFAPHFDLPPDSIRAAAQAEVIREYGRRGYKLECAGHPPPESRISQDDDHVCWAVIKAAYDNVPASRVVFFFRKGELQHVKVDFPERAFRALQDYLARRLAGTVRLDAGKPGRFGTDIYGKPLMVWLTAGGIVVTSSAPTGGQAITLLWTSKEAETRRICAEWALHRDALLARLGEAAPEQIREQLRRQRPPLKWPDANCDA